MNGEADRVRVMRCDGGCCGELYVGEYSLTSQITGSSNLLSVWNTVTSYNNGDSQVIGWSYAKTGTL